MIRTSATVGLRRFSGALTAVVVGAVLAIAGAAPAANADVSPPDFESFAAQYHLSRDAEGHAHLRVVETIVALYPDYDYNKGFYRDLPKFYQEMPLNPTVLSVTDETGRDIPYSVEDYEAGDGLELKYSSIALGDDDYVTGRKTYVIEYTLDNVVQHFDDPGADEFYWDVNGVDTSSSIDGPVSVVLTVEDDLVEHLTGNNSCYPGYYAAEQGCQVEVSDDGATLSASAPRMSPYDTLTINVLFDAGTFVPGDRLSDNWIFDLLPRLLLAFSALVLLIALVVRLGFWRDAKGRGIIVPQYSVPDDHDILLAADVIGRGHEALAAAFVDLAVRGYVDVVDLRPGSPDDDDRFALAYRSKDGATKQELALLKALFDDMTEGEQAKLGSLGAPEGAALYALGLRARDRAVAAGLRAQPGSGIDVVLRRSLWVVILGFAAVFIWTFAVDIDAGPVFGWLLGSLAAYGVAGAVLAKPYLLTPKGAELRDYLIGMRDYLELAEEDRLRVLQSPDGAERIDTSDRGLVVKLHEKLLPYAVLWDVERDWAKELEVEYAGTASSPTWISSDLGQVDLGRALSSFSRGSISSVRPIVPVRTYSSGSGGGSSWSGGSSSFSSGSSGGGFSGGGGGGGGMRGR